MDLPTETAHARPLGAELPPNASLRIFQDLTLPDLVAAGQACLAWHAVTASDSLWSSILQQQHCAEGTCAAIDAASAARALSRHASGDQGARSVSCSSSCVRLGQLQTASLWATGQFSAETTAAAPEEVKTLPLSISCTEPRKLWSAQQARQQAAGTASANSAFAVSAAAAGRSHLVLLGGAGQVVDTRSLFLLPSQHDAPSASTVCATAAAANLRLLLVDLLQQQQQQQPGGGSLEPEPHWHFAASWLRAGQHIKLHKPWLSPPPGGVPVTSVASGDGHVLAVAGGRVWGWGSNQVGQLGLGSCSPWQATPADITAALDGAWKPQEAGGVQAAACGSNHSVLLTDSGAVYTAGCNSSGQCGQDKGLKECPVFCQPHMAEAEPVAAGAAAPFAGSLTTPSSRQQRSTDSSASPDASTLPDPTAVSDNPPSGPRALLPPAAAIAAGPSNTLAATRSGRVLVCGASGSGQCGAAWVRAPACPGFVDLGPELSWHGLTRPSAAEVDAAGGQVADALAKVVAVAAGEGTCYALTDAGEVFAWGQGSKGQLGTGGCPKVQATPAKLPWARHIRHISVSPTGQFAAAVDTAGKLYSWGAGKWGQLGHGDTSKRTVGRLVKQLRHLDVLQVCCTAESMLVLTAQHIPPMMRQQQQQHNTHSTSDATLPGQKHAPSPQPKQKKAQHTAQKQTPTALASAAEASSSRASTSSKHSRRSRQQQEQASVSAHAAAGASGGSSNATEQLLGDMSGVDWKDVDEQGPFFCPAPKPDSRHSSSRRRSAAGADPEHAAPSPCDDLGRAGSSSSAGSSSGSTTSGSSPQQQRHARMDKGFKRLLKRLLAGFMTDSSQREMTFPASLSAADRYHVHVAAEAYGLAHASHSEGGDRVIKVWKVSRTRKAYSGGGYVSDDDGSD